MSTGTLVEVLPIYAESAEYHGKRGVISNVSVVGVLVNFEDGTETIIHETPNFSLGYGYLWEEELKAI